MNPLSFVTFFTVGELATMTVLAVTYRGLTPLWNELVGARAVLGAGTILTRSTPLYDLVRGEVYRATHEQPLEVPENAVVVPGSRAVKKGNSKIEEWNLSLYTPVIVKYRDEKTASGIELEEWLR